MEIRADAGKFFEIETDALVVAVYEGEKPEGGALAEIDKRTGGVLTSLIETGELTGKAGETAYVHSTGDMKARRILFMGAGKLADLNTDGIRRLAGAAARLLRAKKVRSFAFLRRSQVPLAESSQAATEGAILGLYDPDKYRTSEKCEDHI